MQNARSMPAITPGRGIVLQSYLSMRPVSPAPSAINPCVKMSSNSPPEASRRISFPRRHLQRSSVRNCGGRTLVQESPIEWRRNLSSVRPLAVTGGAEEELDRIGKPENCTADELHYVAVPRTAWRLALWRYVPPKFVSRFFRRQRGSIPCLCFPVLAQMRSDSTWTLMHHWRVIYRKQDLTHGF